MPMIDRNSAARFPPSRPRLGRFRAALLAPEPLLLDGRLARREERLVLESRYEADIQKPSSVADSIRRAMQGIAIPPIAHCWSFHFHAALYFVCAATSP
jgi:hypothetical protein